MSYTDKEIANQPEQGNRLHNGDTLGNLFITTHGQSRIQTIHQRYSGLVSSTGVIRTDRSLADNPDQVLADIFYLLGCLDGRA